MHSNLPTFRGLVIGPGLLRPLGAAEREDALRKCTAYLEYRMRSGSSMRSVLDHQLAVAVLER